MNVTELIPRDAIIIPKPLPQDWAGAQIVAGSIGARIPLSDPTLNDSEFIAAYRCFALMYHVARNDLLRTGVIADRLDNVAAEAIKTRQAREQCIHRSAVASIIKPRGIGFNDLSPENRIAFFLGVAAMLADIQDEFDRRGLSDPNDPRKMVQ